MPRLTERQAAFARHLITGMSATEAARKAGYSHTYANREAKKLVDKPQVAAYLDELRAEIERTAIADGREAREVLTRILRQEMTEDTIAGKDPVLFKTRPNAGAVVRAIKTLGELEGWFSNANGAADNELGAIAAALARADDEADRAVN